MTEFESKPLTRADSARRTVAAVLLALGVLLVTAVPALAVEGGRPAWSLQINSTPTNFQPEYESDYSTGPLFNVSATNLGGERTSGTFKVIIELPPGAVVAEPFGVAPSMQYGREGPANNSPFPCGHAGQVVTCVGGEQGSYVPADSVVNVLLNVNVTAAAGEVLQTRVTIEGGGAEPVTKTLATKVSNEEPSFDVSPGSSGLFGSILNEDGTVTSQAGSRPGNYEILSMNVNHIVRPNAFTSFIVDGGMRNVEVNLPRGMVVNPEAAPQCTEAQLEASAEEANLGLGCPADSQIGTIGLRFAFGGRYQLGTRPLYNMVPPAGAPAEFGFEFLEGLYSHIKAFVRTGDDYGLSAIGTDIPEKLPVAGIKVNFWGDPTSDVHDEERTPCNNYFHAQEICPPEEKLDSPFVTMPSDCGRNLQTKTRFDSWLHEDDWVERFLTYADPNENPIAVTGCNRLSFAPSIESKATTTLADAPTGLNFSIHVPQSSGIDVPATANVKDVKVTLPEGLVVNPSAADGLGVCTEAQFSVHTAQEASCPDSAKVGTVEIITPLQAKPLSGAVYIAKPYENEFNSLLALYIAVADPRTGVVVKLPGEVKPDPATGQLTATFKENPELPFSDLKVTFFNGARAPLTNPPTCGTQATAATITPWTTPEGTDVIAGDSYETTAAENGGECPASAGQLPNQLSFDAGTQVPQAGAYTPFLLKLTRPDGSQRITSVDTTLPAGLTGKLAGIPYCSEAQIAAAQARSHANEGVAEQASPSCPSDAEVGTVTVGSGSGPNPLYVGGHVYLAGPYKGAPISFVVITPAVAGPFDLGVVTTRIALQVNPETAQIRAVSDPLPTILQGVPLDIRSIALKLGRSSFTLNPTSCDPMSVAAQIGSAAGSSTSASSPFQVGGCPSLGFKPTLAVKLTGGTRRAKNPALTATLTQPPGQANIGSVSLTLPHSAFLDQSHIRTVCTRVQFNAGNQPGAGCPPGSVYGEATAWTPLLGEPISGPVFLRSSSHELPDLVVALRGQVNIVLDGRVDSVKGRLRNSFEMVPDAPVSKFVLKMQGGKKGLVVNSTNLCKSTNRALLKMRGQNGAELEAQPVVSNSCKKAKHKKHRKHAGHGGKHKSKR